MDPSADAAVEPLLASMRGIPSPTTGSVLSTSTRAALAACERIGLDGDALLRKSGLSRAALEDVEARIPTRAADAFWAAAYAQSGDPLLALRVALSLAPGSYPVFHYLGACAPSLGVALERMTRYFPIVDRRVEWSVARDEPRAEVALVMRVAGAGRVPRPAAEYTFGAILVETRAATTLAWQPKRIELEGEADAGARAAYAEAFGCALVYEAARTALVLDRATWDAVPPRADAGLFTLLDRHAEAVAREVPEVRDTTARVREAASARLEAGQDVAVEAVARELGLGARTLQRRLADEGTSFAEVLDALRATAARRILADPSVAICEAAFLLGFSDQSAFTRAFKRWTGTTPAAVRQRGRR